MQNVFVGSIGVPLLILSLIWPLYPVQAAPDCDGYLPEVEIQVIRKMPRFVDNVGTAQLAAKAGVHLERDAGYVIPGVYLPYYRYEYFPKTETVKGADGRRCTILTRLDVEVHLRQEIYVSADFKPGSCHYEVIRDHEFQHMHFDNEALDAFVKYAAEDLRAMFAQRNRYASRAEIKKLLRPRVKANIARFREHRDRLHATIDVGGDHNFAFDRCGGAGGGPMRMGPSGGGLRLF